MIKTSMKDYLSHPGLSTLGSISHSVVILVFAQFFDKFSQSIDNGF
jgi:hypothetical protein